MGTCTSRQQSTPTSPSGGKYKYNRDATPRGKGSELTMYRKNEKQKQNGRNPYKCMSDKGTYLSA